eukprot:3745808-Heterocapsa_arctica.AAC.1
MSVFTEDQLLLVADNEIDEIKRILDVDMKLKWTDVIGNDWKRYLGKEWRSCDNGTFELRAPP